MSEAVGFVACVLAGVLFGSNFVPTKKYEVGDAIFFQWVMCVGIWCVGLVSISFSDDLESKEDYFVAKFHPLSMLGGFLWCTGNVMCLQVMKLIGMSMGLMVWGITNSVMAWMTGKFGLFGLDKNKVSNDGMNIAGLLLTVLSLAVFSQVKTSIKPVEEKGDLDEPFIQGNIKKAQDEKEENWVDGINPKLRHGIGFAGACVCGVFFGLNFVPPLYEKAHGGPNGNLDYVFSHFCGIFATSTLFMIIYSFYKKNDPFVKGYLVLPALASGVMWGIAQVSLFLAIQELQIVIANPIIAVLPSVVAGLWGVLLFKEISGPRDVGLFCGGTFIAVIGVVLIAASN